MNRLTFTKEFKKHEEIGHILCLKPEKLIEWEEKLSQYEDIGEPKELIKRPSLDENGLAQCGCGGKAILFHQPDIEGPGSDGDRWAVFCEKTCGMETSGMTSPEYAVETWNTGMGWRADKPKPAQHEQVSPATQHCPVCSTPLESRGGYIRVIIGKRDMTSEVQGASWYCAECDRAWDYGDLPSNTRQLPQPPKSPPTAAMSSADICTRLRWLILQAEKGSARVEAADWEAVRQACRALEGRVDVAPGFDSARPGKD